MAAVLATYPDQGLPIEAEVRACSSSVERAPLVRWRARTQDCLRVEEVLQIGLECREFGLVLLRGGDRLGVVGSGWGCNLVPRCRPGRVVVVVPAGRILSLFGR